MRNWTISRIFRPGPGRGTRGSPRAGRLWHAGAVAALATLTACAPSAEAPAVDADDIGGVVTGAGGPEAGVWVIAETADLPTRLARIVVTDEEGRYLIPDLPEASYDVWVRGYGLVDSDKLRASPGTALDLTAVSAPDARAAAEYYPAGYWLSLLSVPEEHEFPGSGDEGNGISPNIENQAQLLRLLKSGNCTACHQMGGLGTRKIPAELGDFESSVDAWDRRIKSGQAGAGMSGGFDRMGRRAMLDMFADWTDRIAAGEVPREAPPRPEGMERNVVVTLWDWADPKAYLHDEASTDRRNPTVNANGPIFGALEASADYVPVLDPVSNAASQIPLTVRDPSTRPASGPGMPEPSPYWGTRPSGRAGTTSTTRCWTSAVGSGLRPRCARPRIRTSAARGRTTRRRGSSRRTAPGATSRCTIRRRRSSRTSAPVSARTTSCSRRTRTTRSGRAAVDRWWAG